MSSLRLIAPAAITFEGEEAQQPSRLTKRYLWTGWRNRHWPADLLRPGLRLHGFDKKTRRLFVLLEVTHGGSFTYRTRSEFARKVEEITRWAPDLSSKGVPVAPRGQRPCTGIALRWKVIQTVNMPLSIRFPRLGWLLLDAALINTVTGGADLFGEGQRQLRNHLAVERNASLRRLARAYWRQELGRLRCLACGFDFEEVYGHRGTDFVEMHHERPLARTGPTKNRPKDLKPLCSNCHRMVHRFPDQPLAIVELRRALRS